MRRIRSISTGLYPWKSRVLTGESQNEATPPPERTWMCGGSRYGPNRWTVGMHTSPIRSAGGHHRACPFTGPHPKLLVNLRRDAAVHRSAYGFGAPLFAGVAVVDTTSQEATP